MYYSVAMIPRTLMVLGAAALAVLLAGCSRSQQEDRSNSQHGSGSQDGISSWLQSEAADIDSAGACTGSAGADLQQEGRGEVSNGKIAFSRTNADLTSRVYVIDEDGSNETGLTDNLPSAGGPVWSPDGEQIAFTRQREDPTPTDIYVMDADGTNERPLADNPAMRLGSAWSPDGAQIAFLRSPAESTAYDIYMIDEDGTNERRLTQTHSEPETSTNLGLPVWSPDGNKIAFSSSAITTTPPSSDSPESAGASTAPAADMTGIYVIDVPTAGICKLTSTAGQYQVSAAPAWSPEGNKIAFYDKEAINVINADGTERKELTDLTDNVPDLSAPAWAPDGERIAFVNQADLYVINADGSGLRRLANTTVSSGSLPAWSPGILPAWSPDGEKIAFPCPAAPGAEGTDLCVMNADGTEWKRIAQLASEEGAVSVSWGRR
jgi:Tol biopolymer transport system component/outer membrane murein-binding lipoprotein Lpp